MKRSIDSSSRIALRTRAKGLLSRLAHDLEIVAEGFDGSVEIDGERWSGELRLPVKGLVVAGALRGGHVDRDVLSPSERAEIKRRIVSLHLKVEAVEVSLRGDSLSGGEAVVRAGKAEQRVRFSVAVDRGDGGALAGEGRIRLSLAALGVGEVKGPLGAFKLDDAVEVHFVVKLAPP
jgi:hypothetical protein